jgi:hypothetical protein
MSEKDFSVGITGMPAVGQISKKPSYLIELEPTDKKSVASKHFITLDKPDFQNNFVQAKGIFSDSTADDIIKNYNDILTAAGREAIIDIMFPTHRIRSVRSLVFNANKQSTLVK